MATMPAFFDRTANTGAGAASAASRAARPGKNFDGLRALPLDDVLFFSKRIDNSRLERAADPRARGACWSAVGAASLLLVLLTGTLAPTLAGRLEGYRLEALKGEERQLLDERRTLELQEAELLSPDRLQQVAEKQNLVTPKAGQVVHLDGNKPDSSFALVKALR
ncbi:MAG: hypothetical protein ABSH42_13650 [Bryobacteraceae bacterium]|jgi:hypothetical protein